MCIRDRDTVIVFADTSDSLANSNVLGMIQNLPQVVIKKKQIKNEIFPDLDVYKRQNTDSLFYILQVKAIIQ